MINPIIHFTNNIVNFLPSEPEEIWAPITNIIVENIIPNRYFISTHGRAYTLSKREGFLTPVETSNNYLRINLRDINDVARYHLLHRIVLGTFFYTPNFKELEVNHLDGNKHNNFLNNLEYRTGKENIKHAIDTGLMNIYGENNPFAKITNEQAEQIGFLLSRNNHTAKEIALLVGCSESIVYNISNGGSWRYIKDKYNIMPKFQKIFTDEQVHTICKYFENCDIKFGEKEYNFKKICNILNIEYNDATNRAIERIYYKLTHKDICSQYNY